MNWLLTLSIVIVNNTLLHIALTLGLCCLLSLSYAQCDDTLKIDSIFTPIDTTVLYIVAPKPAKSFTPNGDGWNDTWFIINIEKFDNFLLQVYNKWGQRVYYQREQYIEWDGNVAGSPVPTGNYYYIFYPDQSDKDCFIPGNVVIIR